MYCEICNIRVAKYDPDRIQVNQKVYHKECIIRENTRCEKAKELLEFLLKAVEARRIV